MICTHARSVICRRTCAFVPTLTCITWTDTRSGLLTHVRLSIYINAYLSTYTLIYLHTRLCTGIFLLFLVTLFFPNAMVCFGRHAIILVGDLYMYTYMHVQVMSKMFAAQGVGGVYKGLIPILSKQVCWYVNVWLRAVYSSFTYYCIMYTTSMCDLVYNLYACIHMSEGAYVCLSM